MSTNPQDDAERVSNGDNDLKNNLTVRIRQIRLKRLAKLQGTLSSSPSPAAGSAGPSTPPVARTPPPKAKVTPAPAPAPATRAAEPAAPIPAPVKKKATPRPAHLDVPTWEDETIGQIFNVTLIVSHIFNCAAALTDALCHCSERRLRRVGGRSCGSST